MKSENYGYAIHLLDAILAPLQNRHLTILLTLLKVWGVHKCLRIEKGILI